MLSLTPDEAAWLGGSRGDAVALAMRVIVRLAEVLGAERLVPIASAHVDGCLYHGQAGLDFVQRMVQLGGRVAVPTTLNVGSLDLVHPDLVKLPPDRAQPARDLMDAYARLGASTTWTCAPYLSDARPQFGQHVAWAESNAIVFANSVVGARTDRYGDFVDICAGVTGRAPLTGLHLTANRRATVELECSDLGPDLLRLDAAWGALGHVVGRLASDAVPVLTGITTTVDDDQLKAMGAAAASRGGIGLFHVVGRTPEAPTLDAATQGRPLAGRHHVTPRDLRTARDELSTGQPDELDAVSVGTPHLSLTELGELTTLVQAHSPLHPDVEVWASTSRATASRGDELGWTRTLEEAGVRVLVDTCTYVTSALRPGTRHVMTNSAKWAWYAPVNLGVSVTFGSLVDCIVSAKAGRVVRDEASWH